MEVPSNPEIIDVIASGPILSGFSGMGGTRLTADIDAGPAVSTEPLNLTATYVALEATMNAYLTQFEPLQLITAVILGLTIAYLVYPRLPYLVLSIALLLKLVDEVYMYQRDIQEKPFDAQIPFLAKLLAYFMAYFYCINQMSPGCQARVSA